MCVKILKKNIKKYIKKIRLNDYLRRVMYRLQNL